MDPVTYPLYRSRWHGDPVRRRRVIVAACVGANVVVIAIMALFWHGSPALGAATKALVVLGALAVSAWISIGLARPAWRTTVAPAPGSVTVHPDRLVIDDDAILTAPVVLERDAIASVRTADGRDQYARAGGDDPDPPAAFLGTYPMLPTIAIRMRRSVTLPGRPGGDRLFLAPRHMAPPLVLPPKPGTTVEVLVLASPAASELLRWWLGTNPRQYDVG